mmetsp:Transcript_35140/g.88972  ORF Transcript_35140/g.88972 Transcript_35140/m.88972 type:complete len:294 (+) Transcript_35140:950-1831(+)
MVAAYLLSLLLSSPCIPMVMERRRPSSRSRASSPIALRAALSVGAASIWSSIWQGMLCLSLSTGMAAIMPTPSGNPAAVLTSSPAQLGCISTGQGMSSLQPINVCSAALLSGLMCAITRSEVAGLSTGRVSASTAGSTTDSTSGVSRSSSAVLPQLAHVIVCSCAPQPEPIRWMTFASLSAAGWISGRLGMCAPSTDTRPPPFGSSMVGSTHVMSLSSRFHSLNVRIASLFLLWNDFTSFAGSGFTYERSISAVGTSSTADGLRRSAGSSRLSLNILSRDSTRGVFAPSRAFA